MKQKEYQIDYHNEPLLSLPLCVGALLLSREFFAWLSEICDLSAEDIVGLRIVYWCAFFCCGALAAWRLMYTIHTTPAGLDYRFLGKSRKIIPWTNFSCAIRAHWHKSDCIYLIPVICGELPQERSAHLWFIKRNYAELTRFEVTKNNLRAIKAYLPGLEKEKLHIWSKAENE